jgi:GNAT superfamily N-acetyltransferase
LTAKLVVRIARPEDVATLVALVVELAEFERARDEVELDEATLHKVLFGDSPSVFCDVAELDGEIVGSAIWFVNYSTWTGAHGIYLEDLYIRPTARRAGVARALLATLANRAVERGFRRVEWSVLDWNEGAIGLYESVGAFGLSEWTRYRLTGSDLEALARIAPAPAQ